MWLSSCLRCGVTFLSFPVLVFLVFFELASSSEYSSRGALLPERLDPSGRPPSESSQSSRSWGSYVLWACCAMVVAPLRLPPAALAFWAPFAFFPFSLTTSVVVTFSASALATAAAAAAFGASCLTVSASADAATSCALATAYVAPATLFCLCGGFIGSCLLCR